MNCNVKSLCASVVMLALFSSQSVAQDYPTRPITLVVPFTAGGSGDIAARLLRDELSASFGQPVVVENRPGAAGTIGAAYVANAKSDGYTLLVTVNAPITTNPFLQKSFPFDPKAAFAPISILAETLLILAVNSSLPVTNVSELVQYAKNNPGKLSYGSAGVGTVHHIAGELLKQKSGIDMVHVPYRGGGPLVQDLIAGHLLVGFSTTPTIMPQVSAGKIRVLALAEANRSDEYPDLPTISETVAGVETSTWVGFFAPAGTPKEIIDRLNKVAVEAFKKPLIVNTLRDAGVLPLGTSPDAVTHRISRELVTWGQVIPSIGITSE